MPKKHKQQRNIAPAIISIIAIAVICFGMLYFDYDRYFANEFMAGTKINGINVSGMTAREVNEKLGDGYKLKVGFREDATETLSGKDIDYDITSSGSVEKLLSDQNFGTYLGSLFTKRQYSTHLSGVFSKKKLADIVSGWPELQKSNMKAPKDAFAQYKNGKFSVAEEYPGTTLNASKAVSAVEAAVSEDLTSTDLTKTEGVYSSPRITSKDKGLAEDVVELNKMKWASVTYKLSSGKKMTLDANTTKGWLLRDENGMLYKDPYKWEEEIVSFVNKMADDADTVYDKHKFKTHSGKVISLEGTGYYGWLVARGDEVMKLTEDLDSGKDVTREPVYVQTEKTTYDKNYGFGDTYLEVDLGSQHLWYYKDGKQILESDLVSGNAGNHATPAGAYQLLDKARNVVLRGPAKVVKKKNKKGKVIETKTTYEWESPVSYWMPITYEGVGLHDANWRGAFGGDIWRYNGSHGCINLPVPFAPKLYENITVGTPVAVYY